jgi:hypothetical protein
MPRHPVVNRRNLSPFVRKLVSVTEEAYGEAAQLAAALEVSTGSIVDTALRQLAGTDPEEVLELMRAHGHLTDAEYAYARERAGRGGADALPLRRDPSTRKTAATPSTTTTSKVKTGAASKRKKGRPR